MRVLGSIVRMAIQQTKKQSDLEKRLRLLRQQVYGKDQSSTISYQSSDKKQERSDDRRLTTESYFATSDVSYLYQDLLKILILSSLAIGAQVIIFILSKNHILNINFF